MMTDTVDTNAADAYLIFVISFTRTKFLENKIYTKNAKGGIAYSSSWII